MSVIIECSAIICLVKYSTIILICIQKKRNYIPKFLGSLPFELNQLIMRKKKNTKILSLQLLNLYPVFSLSTSDTMGKSYTQKEMRISFLCEKKDMKKCVYVEMYNKFGGKKNKLNKKIHVSFERKIYTKRKKI